MIGNGVVPLINFAVNRPVLSTTADIGAWAEHAGQLEYGLALLGELDELWGPQGELAAIDASVDGQVAEVSWDTVLLLTVSPPKGVYVDVANHVVRRTGPIELPPMTARHALLADLVLRELLDAGCAAARVAVGGFVRSLDPWPHDRGNR